MPRKHNVKHPMRNKSRYPIRLSHRGLSKAPAMDDVEVLAKRQARRVVDTCTLGGEHDRHECNGQPWWRGNDGYPSTSTAAERLLDEIFRGR